MLLPLLHSLLFPPLSLAAPQVTFGSTIINGVTALSEDFFYGIRFAQPPTGTNRFKPPILLSSLPQGNYDATQFGSPCLQTPAQAGMNEDCLTLNIFRPAGTTSSSKLPVMVWIYGGGFSGGSANGYNATLLIRQSVSRGTPVIYVNFNYRLNVLGFPTGTEAKQAGALNLGLKDQLAALQWIHNNINNFGGVNTKITVFGQSAGAISIADLFLNSKLESLVRGAIMESGSQATLSIFTAESGDALWKVFTQAVPSCKSVQQGQTLNCLRQASANDILAAASAAGGVNPGEFTFIPVIDGQGGLIPDLPSTLLNKGSFSKIPFITGTNLDDGTVFTSTSLSSQNAPIESVQGIFLNTVINAYPDDPSAGSPFNTGSNTFGLSPFFKKAAAIVGDASFQATRRAWQRAAASKGITTYGYLFTDQQQNSYTGVLHSSEINYVYGVPTLLGASPQSTLSAQMMDYWLSFVVAGNPNDGRGNSRILWPSYNTNNPQLLQLNSKSLNTISDNFRQTQIELINSVPAIWAH